MHSSNAYNKTHCIQGGETWCSNRLQIVRIRNIPRLFPNRQLKSYLGEYTGFKFAFNKSWMKSELIPRRWVRRRVSRLALGRRSETAEAQLSQQHSTINWSSGSRFGSADIQRLHFGDYFVGPIQNILSEKNMQSWLLFCLTCGLRYSKVNIT